MRLTLVQEAQAACVVLVCECSGQVSRIIRDTIGLEEIFIDGKCFEQVMEPGSVVPARTFIEALRLGEPIEEYRLNVRVFARNVSLSFVGCAVRFNHLLIIGSNTRAGLIRCCEELLDCDSNAEFPASALNQFLSALRCEPTSTPPLFDRNAKLYGELETMQRELNLRSKELSRAAAERNRLYAMVAHDLRSPLAAIDGYAELMLDDSEIELDADARESLHRIKASGEFAIDLIDTMLSPSAIESGHLELKQRPIRLSEVISGALALSEVFARRHHVRLEAALPDGLRTVRADPVRIAQVVNHLLANAIKHSPIGGIVKVELEQSASQATIRFSDQRRGASRSSTDALPAARTLQAVGRRKPSNIGLALCRKVICAHGGHLEIDSERVHGSTVSVVLPLSQHAAISADVAHYPTDG